MAARIKSSSILFSNLTDDFLPHVRKLYVNKGDEPVLISTMACYRKISQNLSETCAWIWSTVLKFDMRLGTTTSTAPANWQKNTIIRTTNLWLRTSIRYNYL